MCVLRVRGPARQAGIQVLQGNQGNQIWPERVAEADVVVVQRDFPRFPDYDIVMAKARTERKPVIYEVDDLILEVPPYHVSRPAFIDVLYRILCGVVEADAVVTSTELLREYYSQFNPNTWLVPNLLDDALWALKPPRSPERMDQSVVVGYMGGGSHQPDLEMVKPVILHLLEDYGPQLIFRFWGVKPPSDLLGQINVEWCPLDLNNYPEFASYFSRQGCDIFIAPLIDNFFNRCKSQIKMLEYSALGVAGVYSQLEPYTNVISGGENGLLAATLEDWDTCLRQLINLPDLRFKLATNAQEMVRQNWLLSERYGSWLSAYEQVVQHPSNLDTRRAESVQAMLRIGEQMQQRQSELMAQIAQLTHLGSMNKSSNRKLWRQLQRIRLLFKKPASRSN